MSHLRTSRPRAPHCGAELADRIKDCVRPAGTPLTLLAEKECALELSCLPGREAPILDQFDDLIGELPLFLRKGWRMRVGVQTGAYIRVDPRRVGELVSKLVQLAHLLEQRLELHVLDRHDPRRINRRVPREEEFPPNDERQMGPGWP
jgi:hypothetical protein